VRIEPLAPAHERAAFRAGVPALDKYFRGQAGRDTAKKLAAVFVLVLPDEKIGGFYTLSTATVLLPDLLGGTTRKVSRYPAISAAYLTRLAVDKRHRGKGHGRALLQDALARLRAANSDALAVIAEAPAESARAFYAHAGFRTFPDRYDQLFHPLRAA
jgi:GNAT superfamily N-acetyltransferase